VELIVSRHVFDAFGWCASDTLEWWAAKMEMDTPLDGSDPARMVFVLREKIAWLPCELARFHAFGLGLTDEWALAPYGIDDATDGLYERRVRPRDVFRFLAADNINALFWGLHDWAHFHNHGTFEPELRQANEEQCDHAALAWMEMNREAIGLSSDRLAALREEVRASRSGPR
jgi:hypothetical protein